MITLDDLVKGTQGQLKNTVGKSFSEVTIDSRKDVAGKIFVALKGDVHDGHKFLADVISKGVGAVVSHEWNAELAQKTTWVQVPDTLLALQYLSTYWREKWGKTVLAITGSNGKTSVKDFAHTLLSEKYSCLKSEGSFNNHWGLPLTLLKLRASHDVAMVEMGMNHAGEIARLCEIGEPDVAGVNNVGRAHSAFFGGIEGIAAAKSEIYQGLKDEGTAIFNLADPYTKKMFDAYAGNFAKVLTFGVPSADVHFVLEKFNDQGLLVKARVLSHEQTVLVPIWGEHNVMNLACAATLALAARVDASQIFSGLAKCKTGWGRNQWVKLKSGATLLFDGYNANPDSFAALLANVQKAVDRDKRVYAVFGEMREQGTNAAQEHFELGKQAALSRIDDCFFIGESAADFRRGFEMANPKKYLITSDTYEESLALELKSMLTTKSLVLVKGSRGGALERIVTALEPLDFTTKK